MSINTSNPLIDIKKDVLKPIWNAWNDTSHQVNSYNVDPSGSINPRGGESAFVASAMPFFPKTNLKLARGLKNFAVLSFFLDGPSIYSGVQEGRTKDVIKNEACNIGIIATASLIGSYVGYVVGSKFGSSRGVIVEILLGYVMGDGLEKLRHTYLPDSYLFYS